MIPSLKPHGSSEMENAATHKNFGKFFVWSASVKNHLQTRTPAELCEASGQEPALVNKKQNDGRVPEVFRFNFGVWDAYRVLWDLEQKCYLQTFNTSLLYHNITFRAGLSIPVR